MSAVASVLGHIRNLVQLQRAQPLSDRELLHRFAAQRDEAAFAALVERHGEMVRSLCLRTLKNDQDAEDLPIKLSFELSRGQTLAKLSQNSL